MQLTKRLIALKACGVPALCSQNIPRKQTTHEGYTSLTAMRLRSIDLRGYTEGKNLSTWYLLVVLLLVIHLASLEIFCVLGPELLVECAGDEAPLEEHLHRPRVAAILRGALDLKVQVVAPVLQLGTK